MTRAVSVLKDNAKPGTSQNRQFRGAAGRFECPGAAEQPASRHAHTRQPLLISRRQPAGQRIGCDAGCGDHQYAARAPGGRADAASHDVGIPRPQTGADRFLAAGWNADRRVQSCPDPGGETRRNGRAQPPAKPPAQCRAEGGERRGWRLRNRRRPNSNCQPSFQPKSSARVVVAKTDTTAPEANAQTPSEPKRKTGSG